MNYGQFKKQNHLLTLLLEDLGILGTKEKIIAINIDPDDSVSPINRYDYKDYYFVHSFNFKSHFKLLVEAEFLETRIYNDDSLREGLEDSDGEYDGITGKVEDVLDEINQLDPNFFGNFGYGTDELEGYKLHEIRVQNIDNIDQKVYYDGGYLGDETLIDIAVCGYETFAKVKMTGIANNLSDFYKELIGESYVMFCSQNYKMAYFIAFTAFECFVNTLGDTESTHSRLSDKIALLFGLRLGEIVKHEIYSAIINNFKNYEKKRNNIAHGNPTSRINITQAEAHDFLIFCLTMIETYNNRFQKFDDINTRLSL